MKAPFQMQPKKYNKIINDLIDGENVLQEEIDSLKKLLDYWISSGTDIRNKKVVLISTDDPFTKLKPGSVGRIQFVDDSGTIHASWQDGSQLGLIPGIDQFWVDF